MSEVTWVRTGAVPWLVAARPWSSQPVVAGVTIGAGWLHQPAEQLGVAGLLAAWLNLGLTRPAAADPPPADPPQVSISVDPLVTTVMVAGGTVGDAAAVGTTLDRLDELLAGAAAARVDDDLRARSDLYHNPLAPWRAHLAARWPGHPPHLAALGPLALATLDATALHDYAVRRFSPASRVYWTNEPSVPAMVSSPPTPGPAAATDPGPAGWRDRPGCVVQRDESELGSIAAPAGPATEIALSLLARRLYRRLVEFEALAAEIRISPYPIGDHLVLAGIAAEPLAGTAAAARITAAVQTIADLADGPAPLAEVSQLQGGYVDAIRGTGPHQPTELRRLARRQLAGADLPTPDQLADSYARVSAEQVRVALSTMYPQLLVAVPAKEVERSAPFPMAERMRPCAAEGRRFRHRLFPSQSVQFSPRRVGTVHRRPGRWRQLTQTSIDLDEVVLRIDTGDQSSILVDRQFATVQLRWDAHRHGDQLRELVNGHLPEVPAIREPPRPEWSRWFATRLRRERRRRAIGYAGLAIGLSGVACGIVGSILDDGDQPPPRTVETVDAGATVSLPDGTTLGIVAGPELIEHYYPDRPYTYALQVRLCAGGGGTPFRSFDFRLDVGEQPQAGFMGIPERPGPRESGVEAGQCATGWLLYHLAEPDADEPVTLHYGNAAGDRVTWRLPPEPAGSPLSKPCPPAGVSWAGC